MNSVIGNFIQKVIEKYNTGHAREHAYRPALQELFEAVTGLRLVNDPKRSENGAPDFVFLNKKIVTAYAEAKDLSVSLGEIEKSDQMARYYGYSSIILTNCLEFRFYKNGLSYVPAIVIAKIKNDLIEVDESQFQLLEDTIRDFIKDSKEPIKSGIHLAKVMAGKARRIRDNITAFLSHEDNPKNENLLSVYEVIKKLLLADLDKEKFADMYAQTLVYGLFVARYYDTSKDTFSRQEARDLVPASNPFLRHFFDHIAGSSFDPRIEIIVNELCEEFTHADVQAIVHNYYKIEKDDSRDPIIHFYEDFLQEYNPAERKKMGVFYTPLPVVRFIVRAIDDILKKEFNLSQGLADASKIDMVKEIQGKKHKVPVHKVQVLDPATGTGTFLNETILHIQKSFAGQEGRWSQYVKNDLLPRLHGFELMMASYTIAHLKLSSTIYETGIKIDDVRLGVYLTNSLEKGEESQKTLFDFGLGKAITEESNEANRVKNELPIMVVMGNPPYSGVSSNETEHANSLVEKYKVEPGGKQKLQERKHWLNDDYVKFIAFAEDMVVKNKEGIVGFITNHGYLDNPTFRGMRWHLMDTFDSIYVVDLHGNANKKEESPDGSKDENIFAIQQGVSIILAIKTGKKKKGELAKVFHFDIWGKREDKFNQLNNASLENTGWASLNPHEPNFFFIPQHSREIEKEYKNGFLINQLFIENTTGIVSARDSLVISETKEELKNRINKFCNQDKSDNDIRSEFFTGKKDGRYKAGDSRGWKLEQARKSVCMEDHEKFIQKINYRPFDQRYIYYHSKMVDWGREKLMRNFLAGENYGLIVPKQLAPNESPGGYITKYIGGHKTFSAFNSNYYFPLYLYPEDGESPRIGQTPISKTPNLDLTTARKIAENISFVYYPVSEYPTKESDKRLTPEDIFDYIYAVLHSPSYREKYKEFLKIDFPRVPYPKDVESFRGLVTLGRELRELHLFESPKLKNLITTFSVSGSDTIETKYPKYKDGNVYINDTQYFGRVPEAAWNFYIGGYQPAQKWLKDRQGRTLSNTDIEHYQKMIIALVETGRIMGEIDAI